MDKAPEPILSTAALAAAAPSAVLRCQAALLSRGPLGESATALAVEIAQLFGCSQVALALKEGDTLAIAGGSPPVELDPRHGAAAALTAAMHEAVDQLRSVAWPVPGGVDAIVQAQRQLAGAGGACSIPLVDNGRIVGAMALVKPDAGFTPEEIGVAEDVGLLAGPVLALKRRQELAWHRRWRESAAEALRTPSRRRAAWATGLAALVLALAVPLPWRVSAPARLEGEVQRAVVAATDGFLQQANVRPGDRVKAGQVLAELASQDLELERRRRESELRQHETAYLAAQARYDRTQMVSAQAKAAEAQAMLSLAEAQLARARAIAPFDGIVIKGDLSQNLGAPVQRGEVLMVLAPSERYRLILEVDEADIASVRPGLKGEVALSSQPDVLLPFTVARIVPVATAGEGRNYFEVEARLDAATVPLRPGLSGVGKVGAGTAPLAVLLTHRVWNWLRLAAWSVTP